jgi:hypothetical protein
MSFTFSPRSIRNLVGVHPDLVSIMHKTLEITPLDFCVIEGLRSEEKQRLLFKSGASKTMNSRHLTGHAVDIAVLPDGKLSWDFEYYDEIQKYVKQASQLLELPIEWGGDWKSFKDGPHFQLPFWCYKG